MTTTDNRNTQYQVTPDDMLRILKAAANISDPGYGVWTYETWEAHNAAYFDGMLRPCPIQWGLTPHGAKLGYFSPDFVRITLHTSLIAPSGNAWGLRALLGKTFAADVLLHEMMHQAIYQRDGFTRGDKPGASCHNNPYWVAEINRIAPLIGLRANARVVRQKRTNGGKPRWTPDVGYLSQADLSSWPHSARPAGYYEAATAPLLPDVTDSSKLQAVSA